MQNLQQTTFSVFWGVFSEKFRPDILCELSAWQAIHLKCQVLFSLKSKKKEIKNVICAAVMNIGWVKRKESEHK